MMPPGDGTGYGNGGTAGGTGSVGIVKNSVSKIQYLDPNMLVFLKDFMSGDWYNAADNLCMAMPPGGGGGGSGGAGRDRTRWVDSGSSPLQLPTATYHSLVTGSTYGSIVVPGSGGLGGGGSVVDNVSYWGRVDPGSGSVGGCGGGGGGSGGIIFLAARRVFISSSAYLIASGGNGGAGASGFNGLNTGIIDGMPGSAGGGGGGGGGGSGGIILVLSMTSSVSAGFTPSDTSRFNVRGGAGASGGAGFIGIFANWRAIADAGTPGSSGPNGATYYIQI